MANYCEKSGKECSGKCGCGGYTETPKRGKARIYGEMLRYREKMDVEFNPNLRQEQHF